MRVYIDSTVDNLMPDLALQADHVINERWNGWLRPIASASAFRAFLDAWRRNDPNGVWGHATEERDLLLYRDSDASLVDYPDEFPRVGANAAGEALYDLTGWVWTTG